MSTTADATIRIRRALPADADVLFALVHALAEYEHLPPPDAAARERLSRDLWGDRPRLEGWLAEVEGVAGGYAFTLETYSSFLALPTLYLEDLFVLPSLRGRKVGHALFVALVREAHQRGCGRMEWTVLDWNTLAIDFYRRLGATHMAEWQLFRLVRSEMEAILGGEGGTVKRG